MPETDNLAHYASPYYDPVKAHEYYMEHRKLKGRSTSSLSEEGKEVWSYTKNQINSEKSDKKEEAKVEQDTTIEELRTRASETRERISQKLKELQKKLSERDRARKAEIAERAKREKEEIAEDKQREIEALQKQIIPVGASSKMKSNMIADRKAKISEIRKDAQKRTSDVSNTASKDKASVTEESRTERESNSQSASDERKQVGTELKSAIQAARQAYKLKKAQIDIDYEEVFQTEYDKIVAEYPYIKKTKTSKTGKKKASKTTSKRDRKVAYSGTPAQIKKKGASS